MGYTSAIKLYNDQCRVNLDLKSVYMSWDILFFFLETITCDLQAPGRPICLLSSGKSRSMASIITAHLSSSRENFRFMSATERSDGKLEFVKRRRQNWLGQHPHHLFPLCIVAPALFLLILMKGRIICKKYA